MIVAVPGARRCMLFLRLVVEVREQGRFVGDPFVFRLEDFIEPFAD
jgi:hypothetical protein